MMRQNRGLIMRWLDGYEGGFVDHPKDPGGATNRGITQRVYNAYRKSVGNDVRSVRYLSNDEHAAIYKRQYWDVIWGDRLPSGLDATIFDYAVHSGTRRAVKALQRAAGLRGKMVDGVMGLITEAAIGEALEDRSAVELIVEVNMARMRFLHGLTAFTTFGRGWTRRVIGQRDGVQDDDIGVIDRSVKLARISLVGGQIEIPAPKLAAPGRAIASEGWLSEVAGAILAFINRPQKGAMA